MWTLHCKLFTKELPTENGALEMVRVGTEMGERTRGKRAAARKAAMAREKVAREKTEPVGRAESRTLCSVVSKREQPIFFYAIDEEDSDHVFWSRGPWDA